MVVEVKDRVKDKTDKLTAAVYLVTNFLDDLDEIKWKLRRKALDLKANFPKTSNPVTVKILPTEIILSHIEEILALIDIAVLDRRASAMNFSILRDGYIGLKTELQNYLAGDWYRQELLPIVTNSPKLGHNTSQTTPKTPNPPKADQPRAGTDRRDKILAFIKQNDNASITDIAKFIPGVSSKTVQRELVELVRGGALKKTGERRWSRYSAV